MRWANRLFSFLPWHPCSLGLRDQFSNGQLETSIVELSGLQGPPCMDFRSPDTRALNRTLTSNHVKSQQEWGDTLWVTSSYSMAELCNPSQSLSSATWTHIGSCDNSTPVSQSFYTHTACLTSLDFTFIFWKWRKWQYDLPQANFWDWRRETNSNFLERKKATYPPSWLNRSCPKRIPLFSICWFLTCQGAKAFWGPCLFQ